MSSVFVLKGARGYRVVVKTKCGGKWHPKTITGGIATRREAERIKAEVKKELAASAADASLMTPTVEETLTDYLRSIEGRSGHDSYSRYAHKHIIPRLGDVELGTLRVGHVQKLIDELASEGYAAQSQRHALGVLKAAINYAESVEAWDGGNVAQSKRLRLPRVKKTVKHILAPDEVKPVLGQWSERLRPYVATCIGTGARPIEVMRIRKPQVQLSSRFIHFVDTKTGDERLVPIAEWLVPEVEIALRSRGPWLFPELQTLDRTKLTRMLRAAMVRAALDGTNSLVTGWTLKCRRAGCGYSVGSQTPSDHPCPVCNFKLWPVGHARPVRFYDLRHTTATMLIEAGVSAPVVAQILGHSVEMLESTYVHLRPAALLEAVNKVEPPQPEMAPVVPMRRRRK